MNYLVDVMEDLYNSEINFTLSSFWDEGYTVQLGDNSNGFVAESSMIYDLNNVAEELITMAIKHYPNSLFSREYGRPGND